MVSEIQLDDAEIEAHLFAGTQNRENSNRMTGKSQIERRKYIRFFTGKSFLICFSYLNLDITGSTPSTSTSVNTGKRSSAGTSANTATTTIKPPAGQSIKTMIALFDYNPTENSPNANPDEELSFRAGDIIFVHGTVQDDGFYFGELKNGLKGLVPSNFLKEYSPNTTDDNDMMIHNDNKVRFLLSS